MKDKAHIWMRPTWGADYSEVLAMRAERMVPGRFRLRWLPRAVLEKRMYQVQRVAGVLRALRESLERTPWAASGMENEHRAQVALASIGRELNRRRGI